MTAKQQLQQAAAILTQAHVPQALLDAQLLLMHCWQKDRIQLIMAVESSPPDTVLRQFETLVQRRKLGEPVAYLCGEKEFYSRSFHVNTDVLIPRPETEHLIEHVQSHFPHAEEQLAFCDVGTGSGCIAVTLACEFQHAHITATDISEKSLSVAQHNAQQHKVATRMHFVQANMLKTFKPAPLFDLIISNPPYVTLAEYQDLAPELYFEPRHALTDEADGLLFLQELLDTAPRYLKKGAKLIVETGLCGLPPTPKNMQQCEKIDDLAGNLRGAVYERV